MINIHSTSKDLINAVYGIMAEKKSVKEVEEPRAKGEKDFKDLHSYVIKEKLDPKADASVWIDDFVNSDAPQFEGKSKEERTQMALGAYYAAREEAGIEEGNEFTKAAAKAKLAGEDEFEFEGETYPTEIGQDAAEKILGKNEGAEVFKVGSTVEVKDNVKDTVGKKYVGQKGKVVGINKPYIEVRMRNGKTVEFFDSEIMAESTITEAGGKVVGQVKDNKGNAYDVEVDNKKLVWLRNKKTDDIVPSGWRLKDVKNKDNLYIDMGQKWYVIGIDKALAKTESNQLGTLDEKFGKAPHHPKIKPIIDQAIMSFVKAQGKTSFKNLDEFENLWSKNVKSMNSVILDEILKKIPSESIVYISTNLNSINWEDKAYPSNIIRRGGIYINIGIMDDVDAGKYVSKVKGWTNKAIAAEDVIYGKFDSNLSQNIEISDTLKINVDIEK